MIAIPGALPDQGQDEQVVAFAATQQLIAIAGLGDRVTEARVEPIQNGGAQEERADILGLPLEDFFPEILVAQLDAAHELLDELRAWSRVRPRNAEPTSCRPITHPSVRS